MADAQTKCDVAVAISVFTLYCVVMLLIFIFKRKD